MRKGKPADARILPHSVETEQCVLGCVLIDQDASYSIMSDLKVDDFYVEAHRIIFENMHKVFSASQPVDFITLCDQLEKSNMMDSIGGHEYITTLTNIVPSAKNYNHYVDLVKKDSVSRKLISASTDIIEHCFDNDDTKEGTISFAEENIFRIAEKEDRGGLLHVGDALNKVVQKFETIEKDKGSLRGIPTGLYALDKMINGLQKPDLVLLAARPGCGKTSLGMNFVTHAAINAKAKVAIFSLEMSSEQIMQRAVCSVGFVDMQKATRGELNSKDWKAVLAAKEKLNEAQIYIDEGFSKSPAELIGKCRRLKREHGLDLVMIDYLQLMQGSGKVESRQQEISTITRALKMAARELEVPILLLSQLSRGTEGRTNHRPMLSDLRESGAIEQDADIVMFIYKPENYEDVKEKGGAQEGICELILAKHRNGPTGTINMRWIGSSTTFVNLEKDANAQSLEETEPYIPPKDNDVPPPEDAPVESKEEILDGELDDIF